MASNMDETQPETQPDILAENQRVLEDEVDASLRQHEQSVDRTAENQRDGETPDVPPQDSRTLKEYRYIDSAGIEAQDVQEDIITLIERIGPGEKDVIEVDASLTQHEQSVDRTDGAPLDQQENQRDGETPDVPPQDSRTLKEYRYIDSAGIEAQDVQEDIITLIERIGPRKEDVIEKVVRVSELQNMMIASLGSWAEEFNANCDACDSGSNTSESGSNTTTSGSNTTTCGSNKHTSGYSPNTTTVSSETMTSMTEEERIDTAESETQVTPHTANMETMTSLPVARSEMATSTTGLEPVEEKKQERRQNRGYEERGQDKRYEERGQDYGDRGRDQRYDDRRQGRGYEERGRDQRCQEKGERYEEAKIRNQRHEEEAVDRRYGQEKGERRYENENARDRRYEERGDRRYEEENARDRRCDERLRDDGRSEESYRIYIPDVLYNDSRIQRTLQQFNAGVDCREFEACPPTQRLGGEDILLAPCVVASRVGSDISAMLEKIAAVRHPLLLLLFHHRASHNAKIVVPTKKRLSDKSILERCEDIIDVVFWNGDMFECPANTSAVDNMRDFVKKVQKDVKSGGRVRTI